MAALCTTERKRGAERQRRCCTSWVSGDRPGHSVGGWAKRAAAHQLAVAVDGIEMDMQTRIGGELLEVFCEADEGFPMTQLLGEEFIESGQE